MIIFRRARELLTRAITIIKLRKKTMKGFQKLVLATAILAASSGAFAMEAMDEESMSATTGQDGLTITLATTLTDMAIKYIDRDGITVAQNAASTYTNAGALIIGEGVNGINLSANLVVDIDVGGSATTGVDNGMLQIKVGMAPTTNVVIGLQSVNISVAEATATGSGIVGTATPIISFDSTAQLTIANTANLMTIQLGNEDQGNMIKLNANLGNVSLTGMSINDANSGGSIAIGTLSLASLNVVASVDVVAGGLQINTAGTTIGEVGIENLRLGDATQAIVGDIYLSNLNPSTTLTIRGH